MCLEQTGIGLYQLNYKRFPLLGLFLKFDRQVFGLYRLN